MQFIQRIMVAVICLFGLSQQGHAGNKAAQILMVVSGYGVEQGKVQPGYEFDEFAKAYLIFKDNDFAVTVASPKGGPVEADRFDADIPFNKRVLADDAIMGQLQETKSTAQLRAADYAAVFVVGGKGAMFDLPGDVHLQRLIADIYERQGVVGAVCHGPASLVDVKLKDGRYLVAGKAVNGFTNLEENLFGQKWMPQFDFMLEDKLKARGGIFENSDVLLGHVAVDQRLVTGQNPASTSVVAEAMIRALGKTPKDRPAFHDETTYHLIGQILQGQAEAVQNYEIAPEKYNGGLMAMYGYYRLTYADSETKIRQAIQLMEMTAARMGKAALDLQIAKGYHKLGETKKSRVLLRQLLEKHPAHKGALAFKETLG